MNLVKQWPNITYVATADGSVEEYSVDHELRLNSVPEFEKLLNDKSKKWNVSKCGARKGFLRLRLGRQQTQKARLLITKNALKKAKDNNWFLYYCIVLENKFSARLVYMGRRDHYYLSPRACLEIDLKTAQLSLVPEYVAYGAFQLSTAHQTVYAALPNMKHDLNISQYDDDPKLGFWLSVLQDTKQLRFDPMARCAFCQKQNNVRLWRLRGKNNEIAIQLNLPHSRLACADCFLEKSKRAAT